MMNQDALNKHYAENARTYDVSTRATGYKGYYSAVLKAARAPRRGRALDVGCGSGMMTSALADYGRYEPLIGVDLFPEMLEHAVRNTQGRAEFFVGDVRKLDEARPYAQSSSSATQRLTAQRYGLITSAGMLEYLENPRAGLEAMLDLLEDDGTMVLTLVRDGLVGRVATKLYDFNIVDRGALFHDLRGVNVERVQLPLSYPNLYLRALKESYVLRKTGRQDGVPANKAGLTRREQRGGCDA